MTKFPARRFWDGRTVHVVQLSQERDVRSVELSMTPATAGALANLLRMAAPAGRRNRPDAIQEIMTALDYVLVADPASSAEHRRMEASKGMTPDGGYRAPEHTDPNLRALRSGEVRSPGYPLGRDVKELRER